MYVTAASTIRPVSIVAKRSLISATTENLLRKEIFKPVDLRGLNASLY